jgi:predicted MPP superfamily phosphohydrolase
LRTICSQAMESDPDLILLTGDFFNVEAYDIHERALNQALEPLKAFQGKTFACIGVSCLLRIHFRCPYAN